MTNQNPQFINSYFAALLHQKSFSQYLWDYDAADLQAWNMFRNSDLFAPSIPTMTSDGSFNTPIKNVQNVQGIVATATQSGNNLIITFTDATLATFRVKQKVEDYFGYEGYVVSAAPGTVTIAPLTNPSGTLTAGTHFKANYLMYATGMIAATMNSVGTTTLYDEKDVQTDYTEITRETAQIARMEKMNTFVSSMNGEDVFYGFHQTEADTFNRFLWQVTRKYMFGNGGTGLNLLDGTASKTTGIRSRLINDSGNYANTGAPIDQGTFENMLFQAATVQPNFGQNIYVMPGIRAARQLSTFYPSQTAFAAAKNMGKTVDIALQTGEINIAGMNVTLVLNFGLLNSAKIPDWHKDSVYILNQSPVTMQGKPAKLIQVVHSSNDPNSTDCLIRRSIPGMTGTGETNSSGLGMMGQNQITVGPVDGATIEFEDHSGIAMIAKGHGLFEYQH